MKKVSIFIIIIGFIFSAFLISLYGGSIRDDQFKVRIEDIQITSFDKYMGEGTDKTKYKMIEFDQKAEEKGELQFAIEADVKMPAGFPSSSAYEFSIIGDVDTFDIGDAMHTEKPCATLTMNIITFFHPCAVNIMLKTTDGSQKTDFCLFICRKIDAVV